MTAEVTYGVSLSERDGVPVARKVVLDGGHAALARLAREAAVLGRIDHPGVVRFVESGPDSLTTEFAGQPLRQIVTVPTAMAANVAAALAATVADLHDAGLAHQGVDVSHVLVGHGGQPRLCSFGEAQPVTPERESIDVAGIGAVLAHLVGDVGEGDPIPDRRSLFGRGNRSRSYERRGLLTIADQAMADEPGHRPTARRLAALLAEAVPGTTLPSSAGSSVSVDSTLFDAGPDPDSEPVLEQEPVAPEPTDLPPFPHPALSGLIVPDTVAELFEHPAASGPGQLPRSSPDHGQGGFPRVRPIPDSVDDAGPDHNEPPWPGEEENDAATPLRSEKAGNGQYVPRLLLVIAVAVIGLALVGAGAKALIGATDNADAELSSNDEAALPAPSATTSTTTVTTTTTTVATTTATTETVEPTCGPRGAPDLDGDGCGDPISVDGSVISIGDVRFQVGRPGDRVTLGDWNCDGTVTPALLRPASGDVFVFPSWTETKVSVQPLERVSGADRIYPDGDEVGCHRLVVESADGERTVVAAV